MRIVLQNRNFARITSSYTTDGGRVGGDDGLFLSFSSLSVYRQAWLVAVVIGLVPNCQETAPPPL